MSLGLYKWPQGRVVRYLAGAVCLSYVSFGAFRMYAWLADSELPFGLGRQLPEAWARVLTPSLIGAVLLLLAGAVATYMLVFVNVKVADYLISVEAEMRKVYWPKVKPWFAWSSELWGSAYVVIIVTIVMAVFLKVVDEGFTHTVARIFYSK